MSSTYGIVLQESNRRITWLMRNGYGSKNPAKAWCGTYGEASFVISLLNLSAKPAPLPSESF